MDVLQSLYSVLDNITPPVSPLRCKENRSWLMFLGGSVMQH